jgi:Fanconi anemia group M protein
MELLETQTLHASYEYMKSLFEQASKGKSKASTHLVKNAEFNKAYIALNELIARKIEHPKLLELKSLIEDAIKENPRAKSIVFSQYRDTASVISKDLNQIPGISAKVFVGQTKKGDTGLSQKEQQQIITEFSSGKINILCATSIAEEGLDIPEVSSVIFYEPIPSAIRQIKRRGRTARLIPGKLIILITLGTLDEIFYYAARAKEKRMYSAIENIKQDLDAGKPIRPGSTPIIPKKPEPTPIKEAPEKPKPIPKKPYPIFSDKTQKTLF